MLETTAAARGSGVGVAALEVEVVYDSGFRHSEEATLVSTRLLLVGS